MSVEIPNLESQKPTNSESKNESESWDTTGENKKARRKFAEEVKRAEIPDTLEPEIIEKTKEGLDKLYEGKERRNKGSIPKNMETTRINAGELKEAVELLKSSSKKPWWKF